MVRDGLYQVTTRYFCAGFVVRDGRVKRSECAPILRAKLAYWKQFAVAVDVGKTPIGAKGE